MKLKLSLTTGVAAMLAIDPMQAENGVDSVTAPPSLWQQDTLTGDWGGARSRLTDRGIDFSPVYIGEVMGNTEGGTIDSGTVYDHCLNLPLTIDLEKLANWPSATFYVNAFWIAGESLSTKHVGDIANVSNISAERGFRVQELWLEQVFGDQQVSLQAGLIAADNQFFGSDAAALFLNGTFGAFTLVGANLPNPPIYPMAAPAARLRWQPVEAFYFQAANFEGNTGTQSAKYIGLNFPLSSRDGALVMAETGFRPWAGQTNALATALKAGMFWHTESAANWSALMAGHANDGQANYGFYGVVEQEVYRGENRGITAFCRGGHAPAEHNVVDWYGDAGLNFTGFIPGRTEDVAGLAVGYSHFSHDFRRFEQVVNSRATHDREMIIEVTYSAQLTPWWSIQPDFQCIIAPAGSCDCDHTFVVGLRTSLAF